MRDPPLFFLRLTTKAPHGTAELLAGVFRHVVTNLICAGYTLEDVVDALSGDVVLKQVGNGLGLR